MFLIDIVNLLFQGDFPLKSSNCTKKSIIFSLVDIVLLLSDFMFHMKNLILINNILLDNDYSLISIFETVNQRIKNLFKNK